MQFVSTAKVLEKRLNGWYFQNVVHIVMYGVYSNIFADACYKMILDLHELKLL